LRKRCSGLVSGFSIPVCSPWDQRGLSCSRNRGLGSGIRAENGLITGSGFAANESVRRRWRWRPFSSANVLVNLLIKEAIKGLPALLTRHLSRLVGGLEGRLLHRSIAHYWSTYFPHYVSSKSYSRPFAQRRNVRRGACWKRESLPARDLSRPRGAPKIHGYRFQYRFQCPFLYLFSELDSRPDFMGVFSNQFRKPFRISFSLRDSGSVGGGD
jgi:hypothetical protein